MLNENRFLDTFRGHNIRPNIKDINLILNNLRSKANNWN